MTLRYPLVCFDLDGTLVDDTVYIWKTLHETFETDPERRKQAHDDFFSGAISYPEWFAHDLTLLSEARATKARILGVLDALKPMRGALETLSALKRRGHKIAIVSGSIDIVVNHLFGPELFDHILINRLFFDDSGHIAGGEPTPFDLAGKADGLRYLADAEGISIEQTAFIGDNENDVWIAEAAGLSVAFNCKSEALRQICRKEIVSKNLLDLLAVIH
jgi:phosphoserine phosphatase